MRTCYRPRMLLRMIDRYPEICPYWNYTLPSLPTRNEENWAASVLKIPLLMPWMGAVERMVIRYSIFDMRESLELFTASQLHHIGDYQHRENLYCQLSYLYMKNITALTLSTIIVSRFVEVLSYNLCSKPRSGVSVHCVQEGGILGSCYGSCQCTVLHVFNDTGNVL
jgi:hypothetical protein